MRIRQTRMLIIVLCLARYEETKPTTTLGVVGDYNTVFRVC